MFTFIWNRITRFFLNRQRNTFRFYDGRKWRKVDPFRCWRAIENHPEFELEKMAEDMDAGIEPACTIGMKAVCDVFQVERFDDSSGKRGLQDWELSGLLEGFVQYCTSLKKKQSLGLTSLPPTDSEPSTSQEPQSEIGNSSADSTLTRNAPSYEKVSGS